MIWKEISWTDGWYSVSEYGDVRSNDRVAKNSKGYYFTYKGKVLKPKKHKFGYVLYNISTPEKKAITVTAHSLVAEFFIRERPEGLVIDHIDGDPKNNHFKNLRYMSQKYNLRLGLMKRKNKRQALTKSKLQPEDIPMIRRMIERGNSDIEIGDFLGVSRSTVGDIRMGRTWTHV